MENPLKVDDFGGTTISGNLHLLGFVDFNYPLVNKHSELENCHRQFVDFPNRRW